MATDSEMIRLTAGTGLKYVPPANPYAALCVQITTDSHNNLVVTRVEPQQPSRGRKWLLNLLRKL
jgi:hypothetical protein